MVLNYVRDGWAVTIQYRSPSGKTIERQFIVAFPGETNMTLTQEAEVLAKETGLAARSILREREPS